MDSVMANKMNGSEPIIAAWLAEGQPSQRDMLESLQALKAQSITPFTIIASHRHDRPEIFEFAAWLSLKQAGGDSMQLEIDLQGLK